MTNNNRTFQYVDKNRLKPWIKLRLEQLDNKSSLSPEFIQGYKDALIRMQELVDLGLFDWKDGKQNQKYIEGYKTALLRTLELVDDGMFDWQPAE
jgi:hypothetical protein